VDPFAVDQSVFDGRLIFSTDGGIATPRMGIASYELDCRCASVDKRKKNKKRPSTGRGLQCPMLNGCSGEVSATGKKIIGLAKDGLTAADLKEAKTMVRNTFGPSFLDPRNCDHGNIMAGVRPALQIVIAPEHLPMACNEVSSFLEKRGHRPTFSAMSYVLTGLLSRIA
jgi:hypothetical protein